MHGTALGVIGGGAFGTAMACVPHAGILGERRTVQEGVYSASAMAERAGRLGVDIPIAGLVDRVLNHGADPDRELDALMALPFGVERAVVPWLRHGAPPGAR